jgi:hypothetical protein
MEAWQPTGLFVLASYLFMFQMSVCPFHCTVVVFPADNILDCNDLATCQCKLGAANLDYTVPGWRRFGNGTLSCNLEHRAL